MFAANKYKLHYIDKLVTGEKSTVYRCGTLVDLCRGPHIQNTGRSQATTKENSLLTSISRQDQDFQNPAG